MSTAKNSATKLPICWWCAESSSFVEDLLTHPWMIHAVNCIRASLAQMTYIGSRTFFSFANLLVEDNNIMKLLIDMQETNFHSVKLRCSSMPIFARMVPFGIKSFTRYMYIQGSSMYVHSSSSFWPRHSFFFDLYSYSSSASWTFTLIMK
jgi:hypothetical protein